MSRKNTIKIHDLVKVVIPERFVRCGYPHDAHSAGEMLAAKFSTEITAFMKTLGIECPPESRSFGGFVTKLGYLWCRNNGFGGTERAIYTARDGIFVENGLYRVISKSHCMTGSYYPAYVSRYDDYDYEPGGLENMKYNTILELAPAIDVPDYVLKKMGCVLDMRIVPFEHRQIEARCVEKIPQEVIRTFW